MERDFLEHFQYSRLWENRPKKEDQVTVNILGGATLAEINATLRKYIAKEEAAGKYVEVGIQGQQRCWRAGTKGAPVHWTSVAHHELREELPLLLGPGLLELQRLFRPK